MLDAGVGVREITSSLTYERLLLNAPARSQKHSIRQQEKLSHKGADHREGIILKTDGLQLQLGECTSCNLPRTESNPCLHAYHKVVRSPSFKERKQI